MSGLASVAFLTVAWFALRAPSRDRFADLQVYRGAVHAFFDRGSFYDYTRFNGDVFTYPPFAGLTLSWLHVVSDQVGEVAWLLGALIATVVIAVALSRGGDQKKVAVLVLLLTVESPGRSNLQFGQLSVFIVALATADLFLVRGRYRGTFLGAAIALKLTPAVFIPYLWLTGQRRAAGTATIVSLTATAGAWIIDPTDSARYWLHDVLDSSRISDFAIPANQSLRAAMLRTGIDLPATPVAWVVAASVLAVVGLTVAVRSARRGAAVEGVLVVGVLGLLISPITWTHHQYWLAAAVLLRPGNRTATTAWRGCVLIVMAIGPFTLPHAPLLVGWVTRESHLLLGLAVLLVVGLTPKATRTGPDFLAPAPGRTSVDANQNQLG